MEGRPALAPDQPVLRQNRQKWPQVPAWTSALLPVGAEQAHCALLIPLEDGFFWNGRIDFLISTDSFPNHAHGIGAYAAQACKFQLEEYSSVRAISRHRIALQDNSCGPAAVALVPHAKDGLCGTAFLDGIIVTDQCVPSFAQRPLPGDGRLLAPAVIFFGQGQFRVVHLPRVTLITVPGRQAGQTLRFPTNAGSHAVTFTGIRVELCVQAD